ncbi:MULTISPECIES: hypothetical protein [unclassified Chamaesiphon]|nr:MULTISPECIES: hypothetical protein [unclassified Chamaesiphon]
MRASEISSANCPNSWTPTTRTESTGDASKASIKPDGKSLVGV